MVRSRESISLPLAERTTSRSRSGCHHDQSESRRWWRSRSCGPVRTMTAGTLGRMQPRPQQQSCVLPRRPVRAVSNDIAGILRRMQPRWGRRGAGGRRRAGRAQPPLMFIQVSSEVFTIWRIRTSNIASSKIFSLPSPVITPSCSHSHSLTSRCDCDSRALGRMQPRCQRKSSCDYRWGSVRWNGDTMVR